MRKRLDTPALRPRGFFLHSGTCHIHTGDVLEVLRTLPDRSHQMCLTSPPYYSLRDYGTGMFIGGNPNCDHLAGSNYGSMSDRNNTTDGPIRGGPFKSHCGKCGAERVDQQIGLEESPEEYVAKLVEVFREVRRVLRDDGVAFINLGDSYNSSASGVNPGGFQGAKMRADPNYNKAQVRGGGLKTNTLKPKDLIGIPWRVAFALQADGWWLRSDIIWSKNSVMPESVTDRCTKSHEYVFMLAKSEHYFWDQEAVAEKANTDVPYVEWHSKLYDQSMLPASKQQSTQIKGRPTGVAGYVAPGMRNIRSVWAINPEPSHELHFALMPTKLANICIKASSKEQDWVLDPFGGLFTTGLAAGLLARHSTMVELNPSFVEMGYNRLTREDVPVILK